MLKSRNVFIDTQAFHQHKFRFDHPALRRLLELCASRMMQLVLTETVLGEVRTQIKQQVGEASKSLGHFHRLTGPLEGRLPAQYQGLLARPREEELVALALQSWEIYLSTTRAIVAPGSAVNATDLLALYFDSKPPFGEGRKKSEFPDAISMLSLAAWMKNNEANIYVVSQDSDLENWCAQSKNACHIKTLAEFIDIYNRAEEKLTELAHKLFTKEEAWFLDAIKAQFLQSGFQFADNWEAEVEDIDVQSVEVVEMNIIEVEDHRALVSVSAQIEFSASISGPDYANGSWDSEDKRYAYVPDFNFEHVFTENYDVSVEFSFTSEAEEVDEVMSVTFEDGSNITLTIDDGYPYK